MPTDLTSLLAKTKITHIYANGEKAYSLYMKYSYEKTKIPIIKLPSTSPANASYSFERLLEEWKIITLI